MITGVARCLLALLDERARLVAVEARHHDVHEDEVGLVVGDLRERVETVLREDHLAAGLHEKDLRERRMVLLSSITITRTPARLLVSVTLPLGF
jgi:hypothetical protein